jgi:NhaP-type Na+/H+ or K+/H+ antiporter
MINDSETDPFGFHSVAIKCISAVGMLIVCMFLHYISSRLKLHWLPESTLYVLVGFLVGMLEIYLSKDGQKGSMLVFDPRIFFFALLPPIIFSSGYNLKKKRFMRNLTTIFTFAVLGTLVSTILIALGLQFF